MNQNKQSNFIFASVPVLYLAAKPGPPTNLTVDEVEKDKIDLSWKPPNFFTVTAYFLEINQDSRWVVFAQVKVQDNLKCF